jgi:putative ABC transport system substrate-binding protein
MTTRREVITLLGGAAAAWPHKARAQREGVRWIGVLLIWNDDHLGRRLTTLFEQTLGELGWTVGRNLAIDYRWGVTDLEKARPAVAQILRLSPEVIVTNGGPALTAAQQAASAVPIVFTAVSEPVERGFVASLANPGGNTTGFTNLETSMGGKWLELLKEIAPQVTRFVAMFNPASSFAVRFFGSTEAAAAKLAVEVSAFHVRDAAEIEAALTTLGRETDVALMLPPDGFTPAHRKQILDLAARYRLPLIAQNRPFVIDGGLMCYGPDPFDAFRHAASYVHRILRGEKPRDLPVQNPGKFELIINRNTANALGLDVPPTLLARADEVIE